MAALAMVEGEVNKLIDEVDSFVEVALVLAHVGVAENTTHDVDRNSCCGLSQPQLVRARTGRMLASDAAWKDLYSQSIACD